MRKLITTAVIALGLTAGVAPARAEKVVHQDARRDVERLTWAEDGMRAPRVADPDIVRVAVDYRREVLTIRIKYAAMARAVGRTETVFVGTGDGRNYSGYTKVGWQSRWQGWHQFHEFADDPTCPGVRHRLQYDRQVSLWTIPASCFGKARRIQVAASALRQPMRGEPDLVGFYDRGWNSHSSRWLKRG